MIYCFILLSPNESRRSQVMNDIFLSLTPATWAVSIVCNIKFCWDNAERVNTDVIATRKACTLRSTPSFERRCFIILIFGTRLGVFVAVLLLIHDNSNQVVYVVCNQGSAFPLSCSRPELVVHKSEDVQWTVKYWRCMKRRGTDKNIWTAERRHIYNIFLRKLDDFLWSRTRSVQQSKQVFYILWWFA